MSFWELSDGDDAATQGKEYEIPTGNLTPIPDGSDVLAEIDEAKWAKNNNGDEYISLRWTIGAPEEYLNRKVFQKLWVTDFDPQVKDADKATKKRDRALTMLSAIDANASGKLIAKEGKPSDEDLDRYLCGRPMIIKCMIWEVSDSRGTATGNWISAVAPKAKGTNVAPQAAARPKPQAMSQGSALNDEIPFAPW